MHDKRRRNFKFAILAAATAALACTALPASAMPISDLAISQIYGGGGNSGATYKNDFVEIFNRGTTAIDLTGFSVQYVSATGTGNFGASSSLLTLLSGMLAAGGYYLVQEASNGGGTLDLPTPDATGLINLSATAGKVALVNLTSSLGCNGGSSPCTSSQESLILDLVGYGDANYFEGSHAAPMLSNTTADFRSAGGCTDTFDNAADFSVSAPAPRNTSTTAAPCGNVVTPPSTDVPEPLTLSLFSAGLVGFGAIRRRQKIKA